MRTLYESLLDDFDNIDKSIDLKQIIENWIKKNYIQVTSLKISNNPNKDGKYEVSAKKVAVYNQTLTSLTNNMFVWKNVRSFNCSNCTSLTSLEGAPKEVNGVFDCSHCDSLTSLKGAPEKVDGWFYCYNCESLTSLEGAPKEVGRVFDCQDCDSLKSLKGAPEKVGGDFYCSRCKSLTSYELPKETKIKGEIIK